MKRARKIDAQEVREAFEYDPETGTVRRKPRPLSHFRNYQGYLVSLRHAGDVVGTRAFLKNGSLATMVVNHQNKTYSLARIIMTILGYDLTGKEVDHINGDVTDNRLCNLRVVTYQQNIMNRGLNRNNTSGVTGVKPWVKNPKKWHAVIMKDRKQIHIGVYDDLHHAIETRRAAEISLFGEYARHKPPM